MTQLAGDLRAVAAQTEDAEAFVAAVSASRARGLGDAETLQRATGLADAARQEAGAAAATLEKLAALRRKVAGDGGLADYEELRRMARDVEFRLAGVRTALDSLRWEHKGTAAAAGPRLASRVVVAHVNVRSESVEDEVLLGQAAHLREHAATLQAQMAAFLEDVDAAERARKAAILANLEHEQQLLEAARRDAAERAAAGDALATAGAGQYRDSVLRAVEDLVLKAEVGALDAVWRAKQAATARLTEADRAHREATLQLWERFGPLLETDE
jgi:hypothetical protein